MADFIGVKNVRAGAARLMNRISLRKRVPGNLFNGCAAKRAKGTSEFGMDQTQAATGTGFGLHNVKNKWRP